MKTKANQSAAERNITMVALADIQPSGFNPRVIGNFVSSKIGKVKST